MVIQGKAQVKPKFYQLNWVPRIYVSEVPDGTRSIRQHCLCEALSYDDGGVSFLSNTSALMVEFVAENMRPDQDYDDFYLSGTFSFVRESSCQLKSVATGAGGEILLKRSQYCNDQPWVIRDELYKK